MTLALTVGSVRGSTFDPENHWSSGSNADRDPAVELPKGDSKGSGSEGGGGEEQTTVPTASLIFAAEEADSICLCHISLTIRGGM